MYFGNVTLRIYFNTVAPSPQIFNKKAFIMQRIRYKTNSRISRKVKRDLTWTMSSCQHAYRNAEFRPIYNISPGQIVKNTKSFTTFNNTILTSSRCLKLLKVMFKSSSTDKNNMNLLFTNELSRESLSFLGIHYIFL